MSHLEWDGVPVLYVHPDDVDLPSAKHAAALQGTSVVASRCVERGKRLFAPRGTLRAQDAHDG